MTPYLAQQPRRLVYLTHRAPDGAIVVQLSGAQDRYLVRDGRAAALRVARHLAGNDCVIMEGIGERRKGR